VADDDDDSLTSVAQHIQSIGESIVHRCPGRWLFRQHGLRRQRYSGDPCGGSFDPHPAEQNVSDDLLI
jgi:hypothetical protein